MLLLRRACRLLFCSRFNFSRRHAGLCRVICLVAALRLRAGSVCACSHQLPRRGTGSQPEALLWVSDAAADFYGVWGKKKKKKAQNDSSSASFWPIRVQWGLWDTAMVQRHKLQATPVQRQKPVESGSQQDVRDLISPFKFSRKATWFPENVLWDHNKPSWGTQVYPA